MLLVISCPLIRVKQHLSGSLFYDSGCINFLQDLNSFVFVSTLPRESKILNILLLSNGVQIQIISLNPGCAEEIYMNFLCV